MSYTYPIYFTSQDEKVSLSATDQEACRKDVERALRIFQTQFAINKHPALI